MAINFIFRISPVRVVRGAKSLEKKKYVDPIPPAAG